MDGMISWFSFPVAQNVEISISHFQRYNFKLLQSVKKVHKCFQLRNYSLAVVFHQFVIYPYPGKNLSLTSVFWAYPLLLYAFIYVKKSRDSFMISEFSQNYARKLQM